MTYYRLLVQFTKGCDPLRIVSCVAEDWQQSQRPPLLVFSKSGPGAPLTSSLLQQRLSFAPHRDGYAAIRMRTKRGPKADVVECYFTDPTWNYEGDTANYLEVSFLSEHVEMASASYCRASLVGLLKTIVGQPYATGGYLESDAVTNSPAIRRMDRSHQKSYEAHGWTQPVYWLTYLPKVTEKGRQLLAKHDIEILEEVPRGGVIITTGDYPPFDLDKHAQRAIQAGLIAEKAINLT